MTEPASESNPAEPVTTDIENYDDPRRPLLRALKFGGWALLAITVVSLMLWGGVKELPGIWGVLIGAAIGGGFVLLTVISVLSTANTNPTITGVVVLGGWLIKLLVAVIVLWALSGYDFYDHTALGVTVIASLVAVLACEAWGVITSRVTYVG